MILFLTKNADKRVIRGMDEKEFENEDYFVPFTENTMFCRVLEHKRILKRALRVLIPQELDLRKLSDPVAQHYMKEGKGKKESKLDVFVQGNGFLVDLEMQTTAEMNLGERIRFYAGAMDQSANLEGVPYGELPVSYVVFLCGALPRNLREGGLLGASQDLMYRGDRMNHWLSDRIHPLVYDYSRWEEVEEPKLRGFLRYCQTREVTTELTRDIHQLVKEINLKMKNRKYYQTRENYERSICAASKEEGIAEGIAKGIAEGIAEGEMIGMQRIVKEMNRTMNPNQIATCLNRPLKDVLLLLGVL